MPSFTIYSDVLSMDIVFSHSKKPPQSEARWRPILDKVTDSRVSNRSSALVNSVSTLKLVTVETV